MKASLKKDALSVCGGLYRMNAPHSIGYLFNPTIDGKSVSTGMFCDWEYEKNKDEWTYFYDYKTGRFITLK